MQITTQTNIAEVMQVIESIDAAAENLTPVFSDIADHLFNLADEAFENEASPDGTAWQPLAASTMSLKGHSRPLHDTGHMRETLGSSSDNYSASVGTNATSNGGYAYPAVHQFGTIDGRIPARPFLPFDEDGDLMADATDDILTIVRDHFEQEAQ